MVLTKTGCKSDSSASRIEYLMMLQSETVWIRYSCQLAPACFSLSNGITCSLLLYSFESFIKPRLFLIDSLRRLISLLNCLSKLLIFRPNCLVWAIAAASSVCLEGFEGSHFSRLEEKS